MLEGIDLRHRGETKRADVKVSQPNIGTVNCAGVRSGVRESSRFLVANNHEFDRSPWYSRVQAVSRRVVRTVNCRICFFCLVLYGFTLFCTRATYNDRRTDGCEPPVCHRALLGCCMHVVVVVVVRGLTRKSSHTDSKLASDMLHTQHTPMTQRGARVSVRNGVHTDSVACTVHGHEPASLHRRGQTPLDRTAMEPMTTRSAHTVWWRRPCSPLAHVPPAIVTVVGAPNVRMHPLSDACMLVSACTQLFCPSVVASSASRASIAPRTQPWRPACPLASPGVGCARWMVRKSP
jgi:hypothetical protein